MDNRNVIIAAILGLLVIEVLTLYYKKEPIEQALQAETLEILEKGLATADTVEFDGRDATLSGEVESEDEARRLVKLITSSCVSFSIPKRSRAEFKVI